VKVWALQRLPFDCDAVRKPEALTPSSALLFEEDRVPKVYYSAVDYRTRDYVASIPNRRSLGVFSLRKISSIKIALGILIVNVEKELHHGEISHSTP
jgi:hypothetical protein